MPWVPTTDFEEEVVNLQPHHNFIYGALSETQYSYPRPKDHTEYAAKKKLHNKQQQIEYEATGKINGKLRVIQQVQFMAKTKPVGEQPTINDWDDNEKIEQETIGMMRYCGLGVSLEHPLNEKVTIATYPVENTIKVVKNGRRKVALFFDENCFKLKEKVPDSSLSGIKSYDNNSSKQSENIRTNSLNSGLENDISFNTSSSPSSKYFSTVEESDSFSSASSSKQLLPTYLYEQRLQQYDKLLEDTTLLSLDSSISRSSNGSEIRRSDSFKNAKETSQWRPILEYEDDDILRNTKDWPVLSKNNSALKTESSDSSNAYNTTQSSSWRSDNLNHGKKNRLLDRFLESENVSETTENSISATVSQKPITYAAIAKGTKPVPKQNEKKDTSTSFIKKYPNYYTTRQMYALKRNA